MKIRDIVHLGHVNIRQQKRRSLMLVVIIGAILSVVFAVNLMIGGVRRNVLKLNEMVLEEILGSTAAEDSRVKTLVMTTGKMECSGLECEMGKSNEEKAREIAARYGGEVVAEVFTEESKGGTIYSLPEELVQGIIDVPIEEVPEGVEAKLISLSMASMLAQISLPSNKNMERWRETEGRIREKVVGEVFGKVINEEAGSDGDVFGDVAEKDSSYMVVGILPHGYGVGNLSLANVGDEMNPLNLVLENAPVVEAGITEVYVRKTGEERGEVVGVVVGFKDEDKAYRYVEDAVNYYDVMDGEFEERRAEFAVREIFGSTIISQVQLGAVETIIGIITTGLLGIAVIVGATTIIRLLGQEKQTMRLYYALGATRGQVMMIYIIYVLELILWAVILALIVGLTIAVGVSLLNMGNLTKVVEMAYGAEGYKMWLVGW